MIDWSSYELFNCVFLKGDDTIGSAGEWCRRKLDFVLGLPFFVSLVFFFLLYGNVYE